MRSTASHADISVLDFFNSLTTTSAGLLTIVAAMPPRVPPTLVDIISRRYKKFEQSGAMSQGKDDHSLLTERYKQGKTDILPRRRVRFVHEFCRGVKYQKFEDIVGYFFHKPYWNCTEQ